MNEEIDELTDYFLKYKKVLDILIKSVKNDVSKEMLAGTSESMYHLHGLMMASLTNVLTEEREKNA